MDLTHAVSERDYAAARELFEEYAESLGFSLCFQGFDREIEMLPEMYGPPAGALLLAGEASAFAGCVGLRPAGDGVCEMKRLYVRPAHRGTGLGRRLAEAAVAEARRLGYGEMILDTMETMVAARGLYATLGFVERQPGAADAVHTVFMSLDLTSVPAA